MLINDKVLEAARIIHFALGQEHKGYTREIRRRAAQYTAVYVGFADTTTLVAQKFIAAIITYLETYDLVGPKKG